MARGNGLRGLWISGGMMLALLAAAWFIYDYWRDHRYDEEITRAAQQHGLSPFLVKAVVWRETRFDTLARGRKGEIGLMQVMPETAAEWARLHGHKGFDAGALVIPAVGLDVGCWCLRRALDRWSGTTDPVPFALAEYNAGRTKALRWATGPAAHDPGSFREAIGYPGTRRYVHAIEERYRHYKARGRL